MAGLVAEARVRGPRERADEIFACRAPSRSRCAPAAQPVNPPCSRACSARSGRCRPASCAARRGGPRECRPARPRDSRCRRSRAAFPAGPSPRRRERCRAAGRSGLPKWTRLRLGGARRVQAHGSQCQGSAFKKSAPRQHGISSSPVCPEYIEVRMNANPLRDAGPAPALVILVHGLWMSGLRAVRDQAPAAGGRLAARAVLLLSDHRRLDERSRASADRLRPRSPGASSCISSGTASAAWWSCARWQITDDLPPGRAVLLGSPLQGSRTAQSLARLPFGRTLLGGALTEECVDWSPREWSGRREVGVIAGSMGFGVGRLLANLDAAHDGTVTGRGNAPAGRQGSHGGRGLAHRAAGFGRGRRADAALPRARNVLSQDAKIASLKSDSTWRSWRLGESQIVFFNSYSASCACLRRHRIDDPGSRSALTTSVLVWLLQALPATAPVAAAARELRRSGAPARASSGVRQ